MDAPLDMGHKAQHMDILALIPARGGSKGLPRKNVLPLAGRPLLAWTVDQALASRHITRVVVTTDDDEIATVAREAGAEVPFMRPAELAGDAVTDLPVCEHALSTLAEAGYVPGIVVWLRPTSPARRPEDIDAAIDLLLETGADGVRSVSRVHHHPFWMKQLGEGARLVDFLEGKNERSHPRRQTLPPLFVLNGVVDLTRPRNVEAGQLWGEDVRGYVVPDERAIDIDGAMDMALAEFLFDKREAPE